VRKDFFGFPRYPHEKFVREKKEGRILTTESSDIARSIYLFFEKEAERNKWELINKYYLSEGGRESASLIYQKNDIVVSMHLRREKGRERTEILYIKGKPCPFQVGDIVRFVPAKKLLQDVKGMPEPWPDIKPGETRRVIGIKQDTYLILEGVGIRYTYNNFELVERPKDKVEKKFSIITDMGLWMIAAIVFILNLPFGYWRANTRKFSLQWFFSIHLPVPVIIFLRVLSGLGWRLITFPVMVGAFFLGQYFGGRLHLWYKSRPEVQVTSCLVWDLVRNCRIR